MQSLAFLPFFAVVVSKSADDKESKELLVVMIGERERRGEEEWGCVVGWFCVGIL